MLDPFTSYITISQVYFCWVNFVSHIYYYTLVIYITMYPIYYVSHILLYSPAIYLARYITISQICMASGAAKDPERRAAPQRLPPALRRAAPSGPCDGVRGARGDAAWDRGSALVKNGAQGVCFKGKMPGKNMQNARGIEDLTDLTLFYDVWIEGWKKLVQSCCRNISNRYVYWQTKYDG